MNKILTSTMNKKAQVTIFIIIAIVIVAGTILFFALKNSNSITIPKNIEPIYSYYQSCIQNEIQNGVSILGQQAGYIQKPEFSPGSEYMPFSSELNFIGNGIPYWYYISGNNIKKEQIPSIEKMEEQLNIYLENEILKCNFQEFEKKGFEITTGTIEVETKINDNSITTKIKQPLTIKFNNETWTSKNHEIKQSTKLGEFYNLAKEIYENNQKTMFLENNALDILRLYAPVDGSEIGCSSKIWQVNEIKQELLNALNVNIPLTKIKGDYYKLSKPENKYFIQDIGKDVNTNINFMFVPQWPVKIEIWPSEGNLLKADPIGLQEGLGMLGFCYVPYHFVYDFSYPILIQIYSETEIFQFPLVIAIDKNIPRESANAESLPNIVPELCVHKNTIINVDIFNSDLEKINAQINFKCFDTTCPIGFTENGNLKKEFPQCVNGYLIASAEGYETTKQIISTINPTQATLILEKEYELELEITKYNTALKNEYAIITFTNQITSQTKTFAYPEQSTIKLTKGDYNIKTYIYSNSTIDLPASNIEQCTQIPKTGISSLFGTTEEKCFTIEIPAQITSFAVSGGGKASQFISESELKSSKKISIESESFTKPSSPEDLQINYNKVETSKIYLTLE